MAPERPQRRRSQRRLLERQRARLQDLRCFERLGVPPPPSKRKAGAKGAAKYAPPPDDEGNGKAENKKSSACIVL